MGGGGRRGAPLSTGIGGGRPSAWGCGATAVVALHLLRGGGASSGPRGRPPWIRACHELLLAFPPPEAHPANLWDFWPDARSSFCRSYGGMGWVGGWGQGSTFPPGKLGFETGQWVGMFCRSIEETGELP